MSGAFEFWQRIPVQRRKRIVLFALAVAVVFLTLWAARSVLGLYLIGLVLAYVLAPIVSAVQRGVEWVADRLHLRFLRRAARAIGILISYLLLVALIAGFIALVVPIVVREGQQLWDQREVIWDRVSQWAEDAFAQYELLPDRVRQQIDETLSNLSAFVTNVLEQAVQGTFTAISYTTSIVLGITIVPFWTFFLLRDFDQIRTSIERTTSDFDREKLQERLAKLAGGVAVINVGAATEVEMKERKLRIEDALAATRAAVEEGIVPGGGVALITASESVEKLLSQVSGDVKTGVSIVLRALEEPVRQIAMNAGAEGSVVVERIKNKRTLGFGYDAAKDEYTDMIERGIIDPTKVARSALQNAASVAAMVLTTESLVTDIPAPEPAAPAAPGGMGGMY